MEREIIQIKADMSAIKAEMKFMNNNFHKLEELLKSVTLLIEKQNVANKRILDLERKLETMEERMRKIENWKVAVLA